LAEKLYDLYNDVVDTLHGYCDVLWHDTNVDKISNNLQDFQSK